MLDMVEQWQDNPVAHPLDSARAKLVRATQQARHLWDHCEAYKNTEPIRVTARVQGDGHDLFLEGRRPPSYLGLILGELVHDLRASLDHLAWALANDHAADELRAHPAAARAIQFPISPTRERFEKHPAMPYFSPEAIALMEPRQPYQNAGSPLVNPLQVVQHFSNQDKHRTPMPAPAEIRLDEVAALVPAGVITDANVEVLVDSHSFVLAEVPFMHIRGSKHFDLTFAPVPIRVCFYTDVTGRPDVILAEKIGGLCEQVAEVVEELAQLFPAVDWSTRTGSWVTPTLGHPPTWGAGQ